MRISICNLAPVNCSILHSTDVIRHKIIIDKKKGKTCIATFEVKLLIFMSFPSHFYQSHKGGQ